ncbi:NUDIX domain-containing protein [Janibacter melonis]|uniref:NUDIX domain-containing protein n=1 Tax=Janibacter melonis TaxID=262209 RepID=UPI0020940E29|nr:NUDIX domain-containing protein [Janibacter melonis]
MPTGTAPQGGGAHDRHPLHLAFSCHVTDGAGRLLLTRRALGKRAWPGVDQRLLRPPRPGEDPVDAVHRYAEHELGLVLDHLEPMLPDFRYRAVDASGVVEHEVCPVWLARATAARSSTPTRPSRRAGSPARAAHDGRGRSVGAQPVARHAARAAARRRQRPRRGG